MLAGRKGVVNRRYGRDYARDGQRSPFGHEHSLSRPARGSLSVCLVVDTTRKEVKLPQQPLVSFELTVVYAHRIHDLG